MEKIKNLTSHSNNTEVVISGWVRSNRSNGQIGFLVINDGSCFNNIQIVYKKSEIFNFDEVSNLRLTSAVSITGVFVIAPNSRQPYEIQALKIEVLSLAAEEYPLQKKEQSFEYLRELAHLRAKTNTFNAVFRIRSNCAFAIHQFFNLENFIYLHSPIITSNDAEGAGETFKVVTNLKDENEFFGKKANLSVSGQLHAEAFAQCFQRIYTFGPTFRAENSNTTRHAAEFWMVEPEIAFANLSDNMNLITKLLKFVINYLLLNNLDELTFLNNNIDDNLLIRLESIIKNDFAQLTYSEAIKILQEAVEKNIIFEHKNIVWGMDLQTEHERYLCEQIAKKPLFITDYPQEIKAFYMKLNDDKKTVAACDLLVPGIGELVGGSQREGNYQNLKERCKSLNINTKDIDWYLNLRKYGYYQSSGFGLGFERLIMYVTGMANIRDVIPFPRTPNNLLF